MQDRHNRNERTDLRRAAAGEAYAAAADATTKPSLRATLPGFRGKQWDIPATTAPRSRRRRSVTPRGSFGLSVDKAKDTGRHTPQLRMRTPLSTKTNKH